MEIEEACMGINAPSLCMVKKVMANSASDGQVWMSEGAGILPESWPLCGCGDRRTFNTEEELGHHITKTRNEVQNLMDIIIDENSEALKELSK